ncbi:MAG: SDR family oxidoreductase [Emergencia sp.]|nr:SDR family oxidoreductase [Emergencia sp.]
MVNVQKEFVEKLFSIEGKVALVTGATGALGSAVAVGYALAGAKVVLTGRNAAKLDEVAKQIKEEGGECACVAADPAVEEDVKKAVKFTVDTYGELNILAACHGFNKPANILEQSVEDWKKIMDADCTSVYLLAKYAAEQMKEQVKAAKWLSHLPLVPRQVWQDTQVIPLQKAA